MHVSLIKQYGGCRSYQCVCGGGSGRGASMGGGGVSDGVGEAASTIDFALSVCSIDESISSGSF